MTPQHLTQRNHLVQIYQAVGRGGELAKSTYQHLGCDDEFGGAVYNWNQVKTSKVKFLNVVTHRDSVELCALHSQAAYFVATSLTREDGDFIYPELCNLSEPASKLNEIFPAFSSLQSGKRTPCKRCLCICRWIPLT